MDEAAKLRYRAARSLFERVVELGPAERDAALAEEPDPTVRAEVRKLLDLDAADFALEKAIPPPPPARLGPYRVLRELGRGAMGTVYEAEEGSPRRRVALKVVHPWLRTPALDALTRQEAQAMADVRHPGIPSIYALVDVDGAPVVAMELVDGVPITRFVDGLPWRARLAVLVLTCDAVACAHRAGITHRDLKPSNILVTPAGEPKVLDFGIAGHADRPAPVGSGTIRYMPPEQRDGAVGTPAMDVYALAIVCLEVFAAPHAMDEAPVLATLRDDLRAVIRRALAPDASARYPDASAFAADLRRVQANRLVDAQRHLWSARVRAGLRRHPLLVLTALVSAAAWAGRGPLLRQWSAMRADTRLQAVLSDERGFSDPAVQRALGDLLVDPRFLASPSATRAFAWQAGHLDGAERLASLASAWVFSESAAEAETRDMLARELYAIGDGHTADALGPFADPGLREAAAVARWDFGGADVRATMARHLATLCTAVERTAVERAAVFSGGWATATDTLTFHPEEGEEWSLPLPGDAGGLAVAGDRYAVQGGPWVVTGTWREPPTTIHLPSGATDVLLPPPGLPGALPGDVLYVVRHDGAGLYLLRDGVARALDPSATERRLPTRQIDLADLDGDGDLEVIVAATGWAGHEVRVLDGELGQLRVAARLRMSAWDVAAIPEDPGLFYVLGGPYPESPVSGGARNQLIPVRYDSGRLVPGPPVALLHEALDLHAVDLDGDGRTELLVNGSDHVEIVDPAATPPSVMLPEVRMAGFGRPAGAKADQIWLGIGDRAFLLGAPGEPTPTRDTRTRPLPPPPEGIAGGPLAAAWTRAASLASLGRTDLAAGPLRAMVEGDDQPPALDAAVTLLGGTDDHPAPATLALAEAALDVPEIQERARSLLRRAHAFDREGVATFAPALTTESRLTFEQPLPPSAHVQAIGAVRRNPVRGRLELDLRGDTGTALSLPLTWDGGEMCVDLDLDLREVDWAAGLAVHLRQDAHDLTARLWRVGGGPRSQHHLNLGIAQDGPSDNAPEYSGPHHLSVCLTSSPDVFGARLDSGPRITTDAGWTPTPGRIWLDLGTSPGKDYSVDRMARLELASIDLLGARLADEPGDERARLAAEGDLTALTALGAGTPWERAIADEALDRVSTATILPLSRSERRALLRRSTRVWGGVIAAAEGAAYPDLWAEAWDIPLNYEDPSAWEAVLDPSLQGIERGGEAAQQVALLRARSLLEQGRVAAAGAELAQLRDRSPAAWLTTARLELRQGHRDAAQQAVRTYLARAASPDAAVDAVADDPELAGLLPDLPAAPIMR